MTAHVFGQRMHHDASAVCNPDWTKAGVATVLSAQSAVHHARAMAAGAQRSSAMLTSGIANGFTEHRFARLSMSFARSSA